MALDEPLVRIGFDSVPYVSRECTMPFAPHGVLLRYFVQEQDALTSSHPLAEIQAPPSALNNLKGFYLVEWSRLNYKEVLHQSADRDCVKAVAG